MSELTPEVLEELKEMLRTCREFGAEPKDFSRFENALATHAPALLAAYEERDRLKQRIAELEAQVFKLNNDAWGRMKGGAK